LGLACWLPFYGTTQFHIQVLDILAADKLSWQRSSKYWQTNSAGSGPRIAPGQKFVQKIEVIAAKPANEIFCINNNY
jgi:hypothetical protein